MKCHDLFSQQSSRMSREDVKSLDEGLLWRLFQPDGGMQWSRQPPESGSLTGVTALPVFQPQDTGSEQYEGRSTPPSVTCVLSPLIGDQCALITSRDSSARERTQNNGDWYDMMWPYSNGMTGRLRLPHPQGFPTSDGSYPCSCLES